MGHHQHQRISLQSLRFILIAVLGCVFFSHPTGNANAQFPTIAIESLSTLGMSRNQSLPLSVTGQHTDELSQVFSTPAGLLAVPSGSGDTTRAAGESPSGEFTLRCPNDLGVGLYQLRFLGRFGISNPRPFLITRKPILPTTTDHYHAGLAMPLTQNGILSGIAKARQMGYFRFHADKDQRISIRAYAFQFDSPMIPAMTLYDPSGREIARERSIKAWPAEIEEAAGQPGEYLLVVHDFLYRGGHNYQYLLEAQVTSAGSRQPQMELDQLLRPGLNSRKSVRRFANPIRVRSLRETPPQVLLLQPEELALEAPFSVAGDLNAGRCEFEFQAQAKKTYCFDVQSSMFDQLTDIRLQLFRQELASKKENLKQLVLQDDPPAGSGPFVRLLPRDPQFCWKAPATGSYRVRLYDNQSGKRPKDALGYQLHVREPSPGFSVLAYHHYPAADPNQARPMGCNLMRSGTTAIRVCAVRSDGWKGPISVEARDLPAGVCAQPAIMPTNSDTATLILTADDSAESWAGPIRIVGKGAVGEGILDKEAAEHRELHGISVFATVSQGASPQQNAIRSRLVSDLAIAVNSLDQTPISVSLGQGKVLEAKAGSKLSVPIRVVRRDGGKAVCVLRPKDLPARTSMKEVTLAADKTEATAELVIDLKAEPGLASIWLECETKVQWHSNPQALQRARDQLAEIEKSIEKAARADRDQLQGRLKAQSTRVEELTKQTAAKEHTVWLASKPVQIHILPASSKSAN